MYIFTHVISGLRKKVKSGKLREDGINKGEMRDNDFQQSTIEQILLADKDRILASNNQIFEATEVIYEAIDK